MDFANVNPSPSYVNAPVVTTVEKTDRDAPQVKPVATSSESNNVALGKKELQSQAKESKKTEDAVSPEALQKIVDDIQARLDQMGSTLGFSISKKYDSIVAEVSNKKSGEIIRQIPSEEVLALREKLKEVVGLFFDEKL